MDVIINNPPAAQTFQTQGVPYGYGPMNYGYRDHHHGPPIGLIALLIAGFVLLKRRRCRTLPGTTPGHDVPDFGQMRDKFRQGRDRFFNDGALGIARERYAKGEINAEEYEALKHNLSGESRPESTSYVKAPGGGDLKL